MTASQPPTPSPESAGLGGLFARLQPQMRALDDFLRSQVGSFEREIRGLVTYGLESSGKRLRPALVFFSGWRGEETSPDLVRAAAIVEMVHLATLVHDDIMDGADMRRNRPTTAKRFGSDAAVLLGDALLAHAVHVAAQFPTAEVCRMVSESTRRVCAGEIAQTLKRGDTSIALADYRRIIDLKTAELFRVSCFLGSRLGGFEPRYTEAAATFGERLGAAYQIYDDLVDFFGEEKKIGKTLGTDLAGGKVTLPLLVLLDRLTGSDREELLAELRSGRAPHYEQRRKQMHANGVFDDVAASVQADLDAAAAALAPWQHLEAAVLLGRLNGMLREQMNNLRPAGS